MDSRGIYDAMVKNTSPLHGLRDLRSGYELTLSVNQSQWQERNYVGSMDSLN
jgi:hypothetical protein